jgi:hypothetical protein
MPLPTRKNTRVDAHRASSSAAVIPVARLFSRSTTRLPLSALPISVAAYRPAATLTLSPVLHRAISSNGRSGAAMQCMLLAQLLA